MKSSNLIKVENKILYFCSAKIKNILFDKIMPIITRCNDYGEIYIIFSLLIMTLGHRIHEGLTILTALVLGLFLGEGLLKHFVRRNRPLDTHNKFNYLIAKPTTFSFPSGHTTSSFAVLGVLWYTNSSFMYLILFIAIVISFSRLYLYVHYPSDVIAGIMLGLTCARLALTITKNLNFVYVVSIIGKYVL